MNNKIEETIKEDSSPVYQALNDVFGDIDSLRNSVNSLQNQINGINGLSNHRHSIVWKDFYFHPTGAPGGTDQKIDPQNIVITVEVEPSYSHSFDSKQMKLTEFFEIGGVS